MFKKIIQYLKEIIAEEYKFLLSLILIYIICLIPVNYYVVIGGGISDVSSRIQVDDAYKSTGSFNISYVSQVEANVLVYLMSFIVPNWERESMDLYKITKDESVEDIDYRADLDLVDAGNTATYWAYTTAGKEVEESEHKIHIIATYQEKYPSKFKIGDELISMDGNSYSSALDYREYILSKNIGDKVSVKVIRNENPITFDAEIYDGGESPAIGISLQGTIEYHTDPEVHFKFNSSESGPSGGLITALEIYNQLTEKDLTNGYVIAGTGTIEWDGSIGEIGGIEYKIGAADAAKANYFLCPGGDNYKEAKKYIKDNHLKIQLIQVDTIQDAIQKLESLS